MRTYYVGMDVHQATIMIVVLNGAGKVVMELVVETGAETVRNFLKSLRGNVSVTFEEGTQAAWLHDVIRPLVSKVIVCDPRRNKLLLEGNKGDRIDALKLAQLLRALSVNTFKRSGAKAAVPEYFRNGHNVGSGSCELRCCGMAKVVKMEILNARQLASFLKGLLDFHPASSGSGTGKNILTLTRLLAQQLAHNLVHGNDPVVVCLGLRDKYQPAIQGHLSPPQCENLASTHCSIESQLHDRVQ